jgi:hypothetical protein
MFGKVTSDPGMATELGLQIPGDVDDDNPPVAFGIKPHLQRGGALVVQKVVIPSTFD